MVGDTLAALRGQAGRVSRWGRLADRLTAGRRVFVAGDGSSADEADALVADLLARCPGARPGYSAVALRPAHPGPGDVGARLGDHHDDAFARQITACAHPGDVVVLLSTAVASRQAGASVWALTGPSPKPLSNVADDAICLPGTVTCVQEGHLVAAHALCATAEAALRAAGTSA